MDNTAEMAEKSRLGDTLFRSREANSWETLGVLRTPRDLEDADYLLERSGISWNRYKLVRGEMT